MVNRFISVLLLAMLFSGVEGQKILSVDEAVQIALKNNFDILVAGNDADIAKVNNTPGNAGMLPGIKMSGTGSYEVNNIHQGLQMGAENNYPSLSSKALSAGAQLSWTLFDGGKMFVTKNKLNEIEALGEIQFKDKVLNTLYDVIAAYYDIVRQKQELASINEVINYNKERVTIAKAGYDAGSLIRTDLLQAKIDLNVTMEEAINQQFIIEAANKTLNELLGQNADQAIEVADSIPLNYVPDKSELTQKLYSSNTSVLSYQKQIDIAKLSLKEYNSLYLPTLNFNAGYYWSNTVNSAGSLLQNRTIGPQVGGTVVIPIYSSGENKRKVATARLQLQSAEYELQNVKLQVNTDLLNAITGFNNQRQLMQIEKENNELSKENIEICLQRLRLGQSTSLELHQAQDSYVQSCTRLINFEYNLKIAEIKLKQLIASL
ncbi:MAG TPA: TolC family protein [Bacteroidales bacterium]|nr:TolC family protein [Bacteroidales bacterium]